MKKVLLLDFEDSFTYNVAQELDHWNVHVDILQWSEFEDDMDYDLLVLGPGPGHPIDYLSIFPKLMKWIQEGRKLFGICLGHQIFWQLNGLTVEKSLFPLHGQTIKLELGQEWMDWLAISDADGEILVQRYNSLAVKGNSSLTKNLISNGEILISQNNQVITYQFHPESVGTSCPRVFFSAVKRNLL